MSDQGIRCHYDVLSVARDADEGTIKKAHRKLALKYHPDKNTGSNQEEAAHEFRLVQQAYECLSDPTERKWYDEHRTLILSGNKVGDGTTPDTNHSHLFDILPYHTASCYDSFSSTSPTGFYTVYTHAFSQIAAGEKRGWIDEGNVNDLPRDYPLSFGDEMSPASDVFGFYAAWESFASVLSFAWADKWDVREAENRRIRRAMEDENRKERKRAKREWNEEVLGLVRFVKRRDPRVVKFRLAMEEERKEKERGRKEEMERKKRDAAGEREAWKKEAQKMMAEREANDLNAGRIRLADLDDDDDEFYGGRGKKKKGKKNRKNKNKRRQKNDDDDDNDDNNQQSFSNNNAPQDTPHEPLDTTPDTNTCVNDDDDNDVPSQPLTVNKDNGSISSDDDDEPIIWRCECCRKDFKSEKQFDNHVKSKKHKEAWKKYEKELVQRMAVAVEDVEIDDDDDGGGDGHDLMGDGIREKSKDCDSDVIDVVPEMDSSCQNVHSPTTSSIQDDKHNDITESNDEDDDGDNSHSSSDDDDDESVDNDREKKRKQMALERALMEEFLDDEDSDSSSS